MREQGLGIAAAAAASVQALGGGGGGGGGSGSMTSRSLPGMGGAGKLASSVSPSSRSGGSSSAVVSVDHHHSPVVELVAKESTVATWNLQRRMDWGEIKQVIVDPENKGRRMKGLGGEYVNFFHFYLVWRG